jgi:integrase
MTIRHRPDRGRWQVDRKVGGKRVKRLATGMAEAERIERSLERADREGGWWVELRDVLHGYEVALRSRAKETSRRNAAYHSALLLGHFGPTFNVGQMVPADIDAFVGALRAKGLSTSSINGALRTLRAATRRAEEAGQLRVAPRVRLLREGRRLPSILSLAQVDELLGHAKAPADLAILLAAHAGLRHQEILHLTVGDVDLQAGLLRVTPKEHVGWSPKSYHERAVPLSRRLRETLEPIVHRRHRAVWLFPGGAEGRPRLSLATEVRAAFRAAGLWDPAKKPGLHMLRRTFASTLLASGADLKTVMEVCGWSSITVAERYLASTDDRKRDAVATAFDGD